MAVFQSVPSSTAELTQDAPNLREGQQGVAHARHDELGRAVERDAGRKRGRHPQGPLVQLGQELGAEPREQPHADGQHGRGGGHDGAAVVQGPAERGAVHAQRRRLDRRLLAAGLPAQHEEAEQRNQREREDEGAHQGCADRVRHRREDATFHPLEREDRDVGDDDDEEREERRPRHLLGGFEHGRAGLPATRDARQPMRHVLHHDHCPVDDDPEVDRAEREQVGGHPAELQVEKGTEERERDDERHDEGRPQAHQEDADHEHDEQRAEHEVVGHGSERPVHQAAAIVERVDMHPGRQDAVVQLLDLGVEGVEHDRRILPAPHEHDALDRLGIPVARHDAATGHGADGHARHVADADRRPAPGRDHDVLDVLAAGQRAESAHDVLFVAVLDVVPPRVRVRAAERVEHLPERQAARLQLLRGHLDLVLLDEAAERHHVGNPRHLLQVPLHHPILDLPQLHRRVALADQRVAVDLAGRRGERPERRLDPVRRVDLRQALVHLLAREVEVGAIVEGEHDERESEDGEGVHAGESGQPVHLVLDGQRHLALHLLRGVSREEGDHLDLGIRQLREGLDRQVPEGEGARDRKCRGQREEHDRPVEREREDAEHRLCKCKGGASAEARISRQAAIGRVANGHILPGSAPHARAVKRLTPPRVPARLTPP